MILGGSSLRCSVILDRKLRTLCSTRNASGFLFLMFQLEPLQWPVKQGADMAHKPSSNAQRIAMEAEKLLFDSDEFRSRISNSSEWCFPSQVREMTFPRSKDRVADPPPGTSTRALAHLRSRLVQRYLRGVFRLGLEDPPTVTSSSSARF
jgi:hypothetical protein